MKLEAKFSPPINLLAISGSLRHSSSNKTLLQAAAILATDEADVHIYNSIADLPHFNPDLDGEAPPPAVADFRDQLRNADGVLICTPEYAHGVPGALKNALDWTVGSGEFMHKPVALINPSATSFHAQESLTETLTVMMAKVQATRIPLRNNKMAVGEMLADAEIVQLLREVITGLVDAI